MAETLPLQACRLDVRNLCTALTLLLKNLTCIGRGRAGGKMLTTLLWMVNLLWLTIKLMCAHVPLISPWDVLLRGSLLFRENMSGLMLFKFVIIGRTRECIGTIRTWTGLNSASFLLGRPSSWNIVTWSVIALVCGESCLRGRALYVLSRVILPGLLLH